MNAPAISPGGQTPGVLFPLVGVGPVLVGGYAGRCIRVGDAPYSRGWRHLEDGHGSREIPAFRQAAVPVRNGG